MIYDDLKEQLKTLKPKLVGEWVLKNSGYENDLCRILSWIPNKNRYWDAKWKNYLIEIKKGKSSWLDLIRYSEILMQTNDNASKKTITIFFMVKNNIITKIIGVETDKIIERILDKERANFYLKEPKKINCQYPLSQKEIKSLGSFEV